MLPAEAAWTRKENIQGNNEHVTANADMSDYQSLMDKIEKLNQLCNVSSMLRKVRELNTSLVNGKDDLARIQVFTDVVNGKY